MEGSQTETLPKHVAIIMDGNNRWASEKNLPGVAGHKKGVERARESVESVSYTHQTLPTIYSV